MGVTAMGKSDGHKATGTKRWAWQQRAPVTGKSDGHKALGATAMVKSDGQEQGAQSIGRKSNGRE